MHFQLRSLYVLALIGGAYCGAAAVTLTSLYGTTSTNGHYSTTASATPTNVASGTITAFCTAYYTVVSGDTCDLVEEKAGGRVPDSSGSSLIILLQNGITAAQFLAWNPEINSGCTNLEPGEAYCVAASATPSTSSMPTSAVPTPSNVAPGTVTASCTKYHTVVSGDTCNMIEGEYDITATQLLTWNPEINTDCTNLIIGENGITAAQFLAWNPEINSGCTNLELGEAYCVAASATPSTSSMPMSPVPTPSNVAPGTVTASCTEYYTVVSGDTCDLIEGEYDITATQFLTWNPEINTDCTNLIIGEAYCVASS
ncbi:hypothetical protein BV22DRAFT_1133822 [Leucogyrophana mollusca]|uniref:Uncharacterized protein n=1 Tax=Leucogyrophana mollusca TaxID=85980 RepID=A0ACB8B2H9_9AGAM|nr:hypothetical protein BV22DRAFT_1133822 [Leucogyrophana mollusca]